jgi:hypothetical protein
VCRYLGISEGCAHNEAERLRQQSREGGQPLARLRKMVAFDRIPARLGKKGPEGWIVRNPESDGTKNRDEGYQS